MRVLIVAALSSIVASNAMAEACLIHSADSQVDVRLCQQNRSIPPHLFRNGFCQPQLQGQKVEVQYIEQCPIGAFGICRNAAAGGPAYRQDIHYYGVASDSRLLKPYCEKQNKGVWTQY